MFGKLKERLKGWFKSSKEKIEEKEGISEEITEECKEKEIKGAEKEIEETQELALKLEKEKESPEEVIEELKKIDEKSLENIEDEVEELREEVKEEKKSFIQRLKSRFAYRITEEDFEDIFSNLEMLFLENNVALKVVEDLKKILSERLIEKEIPKEELEKEIRINLKSALNEMIIEPDDPIEAIKMKKEKPFVILFFGINGTGKTTSIAKLAYLLKKNNFSVVLGAGDTFRAASIEQIAEHAKRLNIPLIKQDYGSDPAAVGFDAIKYAKNHNLDVVLIDTAGRMHTQENLLAEMEKICRVTNPDLKIFVAESIAGNDATEQARAFNEKIEIDGSILTKADVDEKGGTIISISYSTSKPIFYLGVGQNYEDLKLFNKKEFIESLGL